MAPALRDGVRRGLQLIEGRRGLPSVEPGEAPVSGRDWDALGRDWQRVWAGVPAGTELPGCDATATDPADPNHCYQHADDMAELRAVLASVGVDTDAFGRDGVRSLEELQREVAEGAG